MIRARKNSEHYAWGTSCDGWRLVDTPNLSIIEEEMPPGTEEVLHYHNNSNQFFYMLEGTASFIIDGKECSVKPNEGIYIEVGNPHSIINRSGEKIKFLVVSNPSTRNDRVEI